ncbi:MAG: TrmH family RNA methyltransferase [Bacteroidota bacterium]
MIQSERNNPDFAELNRYLFRFVGEDRLRLFNQVLENRTRYITVVLEDIYQTQNASAVLRTCECFGLQDIHIIENYNPFKVNARVTHGSSKWINLYRYNAEQDNTRDALIKLKMRGYRIVATLPDPEAVPLDEFDLNAGKTALVFGSEKPGISSQVESLADEFVTIPMVGFTESLNISVSAATILYQLTRKLRNSALDWKLSAQERDEIMLKWLRGQIKRCDLIEKRYLQELGRSAGL